MKQKTILHIINGLGMGGAEKNLVQIIEQTSNNYNHVVISLTNEIFYVKRLEESGIKIIKKDLKKNIFLLSFNLIQIFFKIHKIRPDIIHTWLYISDLIGGILGKSLGIKNIIWSIRHDISPNSPFKEKFLVRVLAFLSNYIPDSIISCSKSASQNHINFGYIKNKIFIINNGVDVQQFRQNKIVKKKLMDKYNIDNETFIFGMVARFAKVKNHDLLIKSLSSLKNQIRFKCVLIGDKVSYQNKDLMELIKKFNLTNEIIISEDRNKVHEIFNLIDLNILTSFSECFPNVLIESMSSGTPCLSTNVGEAKTIIGNYGWIIYDFNYLTLSSKLIEITNNGKIKIDKLKKNCRSRVKENYSITKMVGKYKKLYSSYNKV